MTLRFRIECICSNVVRHRSTRGTMGRSDTRRQSQREQDALRQRGIDMVRTGSTQLAVARALGVRPATVCAWMKRATRTQDGPVRSRRRGPRTSPHCKLKPWQANRIRLHLTKREPMELRLPYALWTRQAVAELIRRSYSVELSRWAVMQYLRRWGFVPRSAARPSRRPMSATFKRWMVEALPAMQADAKREHAAIWHQYETAHAPDELCEVLFAATSRGSCAFSVYGGVLTPSVFLRFVQQLCEQARRKIYLVLDGHHIHRSRSISYWAAANPHRIRLIIPARGSEPPRIADEVRRSGRDGSATIAR